MIDPKTLEELARRITDALPAGARELKHDFDRNLRAIITSAFDKLDLVTRDELAVQEGVLSRTRHKLETLQKRVAKLEALLEQKGPALDTQEKQDSAE